MINADIELIEFTKDKLNENCAIEHTQDAWRIRCVFCGDSSKNTKLKRGNYYLESGSYHCFNCGKTCDSYALIAEIEGSTYYRVKAAYLKYMRSGGGSFEYIDAPSRVEEIEEVKQESSFIIPDYWSELNTTSREYIDNRLIFDAPNKPTNLRLYYNTTNDRLVIPWINNGSIIYYQERALDSNIQPKYRFPKGLSRPVYGLDEIDDSYPYIFYLEGALDSIWVKNGVAIGGISMTAEQHKMLGVYFGHELVYFPDNPWVDKATRKKIISLSTSNKNLKIWMWPKEFKEKDVNELICRFKCTDMFYNESLHDNIITIQKARCMLELL